jgi:hypothetical protein
MNQHKRIRFERQYQFATVKSSLLGSRESGAPVQVFHLGRRGVLRTAHFCVQRKHIAVVVIDTLQCDRGIGGYVVQLQGYGAGRGGKFGGLPPSTGSTRFHTARTSEPSAARVTSTSDDGFCRRSVPSWCSRAKS